MDVITKIYLSCTVVAVILWLLIDRDDLPKESSGWSKIEAFVVILALYVVICFTILTPAYVIYLIWR